MLLDLPLLSRRGLIDLPLKPACLEAANYSANLFDLLEQAFSDINESAAPGVDRLTWKDYEAKQSCR